MYPLTIWVAAARIPVGLACVLGWLLGGTARADEPVDYLRKVKPVLTARCFACHAALKQKSGLRVDTVELMKKGGETGPVIVPGKSAASTIMERITRTDRAGRMPPKSEGEGLKESEIALIRTWIDQGAAGPADEKPETDPRDHWAFRPPVRPVVPIIRNPKFEIRNPIDAFIAAEHDKRGLTPQKPADRQVLLRRLYIDLIGLPPTLAELEAARNDKRDDWYERVVDELLASKQYAERWGRHWMDIWRYSDWWGLGAEVRNSQKHIWHWRDWVIDSLIADKGYDQMIREMLAADELYPTDAEKLRATGYLARSYFKFNRNTWLDDVVEHTAKGFLGLTLNCSKCHDHKYDPIAQQDYYRFRAFFEPYQVRTDMVAGETDFEKDGLPRVFDCNLDAPTYLFVRGDEKNPVKTRPLSPGLPGILSLGALTIKPVALPPEAHAPGLRQIVLDTHLRAAQRQIDAGRAALQQARQKADTAAEAVAVKTLGSAEAKLLAIKTRAAADRARFQRPLAANVQELTRQAARAERQLAVAGAEESVARAELDATTKKPDAVKKLDAARTALAAARKSLENPGETYTPLPGALKTLENNLEGEPSRNKPFPTTSSGRRSALAAWMTETRNPLTARVAVNHIWARHVGKPLVPSVFDFGRKGSPPTHPQLLDWLAVEFMQGGWSMKHVHRLIVTSSTYRMSSSAAKPQAADAENRYYWRMNPVRMEAQVIRDSLLHLGGELDLASGGPSIPTADETSRRRSLYFVHSHNDQNKFLSMFDDANILECYRRAESVVPQQALALENSKLALSTADRIARRLSAPSDTPAVFIRAAFETVLGTTPTIEEQAACEGALKELTGLAEAEKKPDALLRARANLVHALLNHNDFITVR